MVQLVPVRNKWHRLITRSAAAFLIGVCIFMKFSYPKSGNGVSQARESCQHLKKGRTTVIGELNTIKGNILF